MAFVFGAFAVGCSDDDEKSESEPKVFGSCNEVAEAQSCMEVNGSAPTIDDEREFCEGFGTWSSELCPTTDLIGCCSYTFDSDAYRDCYYTGYPAMADELAAECTDDFYGTWTNGGR